MELHFAGAAAERETWTAGETITGELLVTSRDAAVTRSVTVTLTGREKVTVEKTEISVGADLKPRAKTTTYIDRCTLLSRYALLLGARPGQISGATKQQLSAASSEAPHRFPFSFTLPPTLPGAYSAGGFLSTFTADVRYALEGRVDRPGKMFDSTRKQPALVVGNALAAAEVERLLAPAPAPHHASASKSFATSDGRLTARAALPAPALRLGGAAQLSLSVQNGTTVPLDKVRALRTPASLPNNAR
jgi:hypothetical protein